MPFGELPIDAVLGGLNASNIGTVLSRIIPIFKHFNSGVNRDVQFTLKPTPYDPLGWSHQISDGGEPTAKYTVSVARAATESLWHDLSWNGEASAGYYTNVANSTANRPTAVSMCGSRRNGSRSWK